MKTMLIAAGLLGTAIAGIILAASRKKSSSLPSSPLLPARGVHAMG